MLWRFFLSLLLLAAPCALSQPRPLLSPRDSVFLSLDTNTISVNYGRPSIRGRVIMGGLVPWGKVWRTGANEATHLSTNFDMLLGGVPVTRGTYTLWTLPAEAGWTIIINKQTRQWGTEYDDRQDLARFPAKVTTLPAVVDTFTISLVKTGPASGALILAWEHTNVSIPFEKNDHIRPLSPLDSSTAAVGTSTVKVKYSKPYIRGRAIWGTVVPYDSVWRTGANAPTSLEISARTTLGALTLEPGSYVLRTVVSKESAALIISKRPPTPGPIDDKYTVGRVPMEVSTSAAPIDPFRIWFTPSGGAGAVLHLGWADKVFSVNLTP